MESAGKSASRLQGRHHLTGTGDSYLPLEPVLKRTISPIPNRQAKKSCIPCQNYSCEIPFAVRESRTELWSMPDPEIPLQTLSPRKKAELSMKGRSLQCPGLPR